MLFRSRFHDRIRAGEVTTSVRRWRAPQAKVGGRYRLHSGGVFEVTALDPIVEGDVTAEDATAAGYASAAEVLADTGDPEGQLYRIVFRYVGDLPDPHAELANDADLDAAAVEAIRERLDAMDRSRAWTRDALRLIAENEGVRAPDLAARLGRETLRFKTDVRRLKALGLTESLEVGYRLSPRGVAFLEADAR